MKTNYTYLLHFDRPYKGAKHYLGSAVKLFDRMQAHLRGNGARLVQVVKDAGIGFQLVAVWKGGKQFERSLKNQKAATGLCPLCAGERKARLKYNKEARARNKQLLAHNTQLPTGEQQRLIL